MGTTAADGDGEESFYVEKKLVEVLVKIWFRDQAVPELIPLSSYQSQYLH